MSRSVKVSTKSRHKLRIRNQSPNYTRYINSNPNYKVMLSCSVRVCRCEWCTDRRRHKFKYYLDPIHNKEIYQHIIYKTYILT